MAFRNLDDRPQHGALGLLRWQLGLGPDEPPPVDAATAERHRPAVVPPDLERLHAPDPERIQLTWIGHATFLIQLAGVTLLTDPVFSERCSPVQFAGPRRVVPPGVALSDLPRVDAVLVSHNHYDHLDEPTIRRLGATAQYFAPLRLERWLRATGATAVTELGWWQSEAFGALRLHCVPAQHFSGRTPFDANRTLWCGWVVETPLGRVYFAGDTGYGSVFRTIGERLGPMRLALLPIGAYRPRWFMSPVHVDPFEAVQIHQDVRAERSVGMHWGTFRLTDEPLGEPPVLLAQALEQAELPREAFTTLNIGETLLLDAQASVSSEAGRPSEASAEEQS